MRMKRLVILSSIGLMMLSGLTWAEEGQDTEAMKAEIQELRARLSQLEAKVSQPQAAPAASPQPPAEIPTPSWPVAGIYTAPDTKDLGALTGFSWLSGTKVRGWVDTHFVYNFNQPDSRVVNANQGFSVVKGRDVSIEGRTFDIHDRSFNLSLAEMELEKVPEFGGVGFKFDIAFGETQDIIIDTIKGRVGAPDPADFVTDFDKTFQHASVSYIAPIGRGLRFDAGKFVTHIGGETIETVKNWNYSHSFFYTYGIPFQDNGVRTNYAFSDSLYAELYVLNGWNVTTDNNAGKTWGPSIGWTATPWLAIFANYLTGPEKNDNTSDKRQLFDTQIVFGPFANRWNFMINYDDGKEPNASLGIPDANWSGVTGYARYKINDTFEPSFRIEKYRDPQGFTTGVAQTLKGYTLTLNTKVGQSKGSGSVLLLRPELRYDRSDANFYTQGSNFRSSKSQTTVGLGLTWMF